MTKWEQGETENGFRGDILFIRYHDDIDILFLNITITVYICIYIMAV